MYCHWYPDSNSFCVPQIKENDLRKVTHFCNGSNLYRKVWFLLQHWHMHSYEWARSFWQTGIYIICIYKVLGWRNYFVFKTLTFRIKAWWKLNPYKTDFSKRFHWEFYWHYWIQNYSQPFFKCLCSLFIL